MKDLLRAYAAQHGITSATALRQAILRPIETESTQAVTVEKPAARIDFELQVMGTVSALMALVAPQVPEANRLAVVASLNAKQIRDRIRQAIANGMTTANIREVQLLIAELQAFYAAKEGYGVTWPPAADFGRPSYPVTVTNRTPGPSWWAANLPGQDTPTINIIREALT